MDLTKKKWAIKWAIKKSAHFLKIGKKIKMGSCPFFLKNFWVPIFLIGLLPNKIYDFLKIKDPKFASSSFHKQSLRSFTAGGRKSASRHN